MSGNPFTIQNVPIKFICSYRDDEEVRNLQYKMFLLNTLKGKENQNKRKIYNTKCSY